MFSKYLKKQAFTLAEGTTHVAMPPVFSKAGFTLAEVLITLGIIGVVAAMTIPTLIANTNGQKFRTQFKKTLSTLNQAGRMSLAQYDYTFTDAGSIEKDCKTDNPEQDMTFCAVINGTLKGTTYVSYLNDLKINSKGNKYKATVMGYEENYFSPAWLLADGSMFSISGYGQNANIKDGVFGFIDVNGPSLPNKEVTRTNATTVYLGDFHGGWDPKALNKLEPCVVKNDVNHMTDIFPVFIYGNTVVPASNAAQYVLQSAK